MINKIEIFDCDGVLVDSSHRYRNLPNGSIDLDYWIANNTPDKVANDSLLPHVSRYRDSLKNAEAYTIIATARLCRMHDLEYFRDRLGFPQKLICRKDGDTRKDWVLKAAGIRRLLNLRQFKNAAVTMWEDNPVTIENLKRLFPYWRFNFVESNQGA